MNNSLFYESGRINISVVVPDRRSFSLESDLRMVHEWQLLIIFVRVCHDN